MKIIPEEVKEYLDYNPETGIIIWKKHASYNNFCKGKEPGSLSSGGYKVVHFKNSVYQYHRIAYFLYHNRQPSIIDHRNGDKLDNRIDNLKNCDFQGNSRNKKCHREGKKVGIRYIKKNKTNPYIAYYSHGGKFQTYLGSFPTEELAMKAYSKFENIVSFKNYIGYISDKI